MILIKKLVFNNMGCSSITLNGINTGCRDNIGSIKEVLIVKRDEITIPTTSDMTEGVITTLELKDDSKFARYRFRKNTSNMTTTMSVDDAVGTMSFNTEVTLQFNKLETKKRLELMALALDDLVVIVLDGNGVYWFLGMDFPVSVTSLNGETGTVFTDFSGYRITLTDNARELPFEVSASALEGKIKGFEI